MPITPQEKAMVLAELKRRGVSPVVPSKPPPVPALYGNASPSASDVMAKITSAKPRNPFSGQTGGLLSMKGPPVSVQPYSHLSGRPMQPSDYANPLTAELPRMAFPHFMAEMDKHAKTRAGQLGHGLVRTASSFATLPNILLGGVMGKLGTSAIPVLKLAERALSGYFGAQAALHVKSSIQQYHRTGDASHLVEAVANVGLAGAMLGHASTGGTLRRGAQPRPDELDRAIGDIRSRKAISGARVTGDAQKRIDSVDRTIEKMRARPTRQVEQVKATPAKPIAKEAAKPVQPVSTAKVAARPSARIASRPSARIPARPSVKIPLDTGESADTKVQKSIDETISQLSARKDATTSKPPTTSKTGPIGPDTEARLPKAETRAPGTRQPGKAVQPTAKPVPKKSTRDTAAPVSEAPVATVRARRKTEKPAAKAEVVKQAAKSGTAQAAEPAPKAGPIGPKVVKTGVKPGVKPGVKSVAKDTPAVAKATAKPIPEVDVSAKPPKATVSAVPKTTAKAVVKPAEELSDADVGIMAEHAKTRARAAKSGYVITDDKTGEKVPVRVDKVSPLKGNITGTALYADGTMRRVELPLNPDALGSLPPKSEAHTKAEENIHAKVHQWVADAKKALKETPPPPAKGAVKKPGTRRGAVLLPEKFVEYALSGVEHIAHGAITFADYSKKMVEEFGAGIRNHLPRLYHTSLDHYHEHIAPRFNLPVVEPDRPRPRSMVRADKKGTAGPLDAVTPEPKLPRTTSPKNVHMAHILSALREDEITPSEVHHWHDAVKEAVKLGYHTRGKSVELVKEITEQGRMASDTETIGLGTRVQSLLNTIHSVGRQSQRPGKHPGQTAGLIDRSANEIVSIAKALRQVGTETGRALAIRRAVLDRMFKLTKNNDVYASFVWNKTAVPTPKQTVEIAEHQSSLDSVNDEVSKAHDAITEELSKKAGAVIKNQKPPTSAQKAAIASRIDQKIKSGGYGAKLPKASPGSKTGAFNPRMLRGLPDFSQRDIQDVWTIAKTYIDAGHSPESVVMRTSVDTHMPENWVRGIIAGPKTRGLIGHSLYLAMNRRRQVISSIQRWIDTENKHPFVKAWDQLMRLPFGARVFGHGTVVMVTHAGHNAFIPSTWPIYFRNFGSQFKIFWDVKGGSAYHASLMDRISDGDPRYALKVHGGLGVQPDVVYDDYQQYANWLGPLGGPVRAIAERGNMGMDTVKVFRSQLFDHYWDKWDEASHPEDDNHEYAKLLSNMINHATGLGSGIPLVGRYMFAPKLESARWSRLIGDPKKVLGVYRRALSGDATTAEIHDANTRVARAAQFVGTLGTLLVINREVQKRTGQKDLVNLTNPLAADWLCFKWNGKTYNPTGGSTAPMRLIAELLFPPHPGFAGRTDFEQLAQTAAFYARSKASPLTALGFDIKTGEDYRGRPYPWKEIGPYKQMSTQQKHEKQRYTWGEYLAENLPIPAASAARDMYQSMRDEGVSHVDARAILEGLKTFAIEQTGTRVSETPKPPVQKKKSSPIPVEDMMKQFLSE